MRLAGKHIETVGDSVVVELSDSETGRHHLNSYSSGSIVSCMQCVADSMERILRDLHGEDYDKKLQECRSDYLGQIERVTAKLFTEQ